MRSSLPMNNWLPQLHDKQRDYRRGLKPREFQVNSWVWRWYPPTANQKLGMGGTGPYLVLAKLTYLTYSIQKSEEDKSLVDHVDHLKPFIGPKHPRNWSLETPQISFDNENESEDFDPPITLMVIHTRRGRPVRPRDRYSPS